MSGYATPSPRDKKSVGGRTSRVIPDHTRDLARKIVDLPFDLHGIKLQRIQCATLSEVHASPASYMKAIFGSASVLVAAGGYGVTYKVLMTRRTRPIVSKLMGYLTNTLYISTPALGTTALIKIAAMDPKVVTKISDVTQFIKENTREAAAHIHLWRAPPVKIDGVCPIVVHAKKYVPRFYSFGIDMVHGMAVTVMEYVNNSIPLKKVPRVTPEIFTELEKALGAFYVAAVDHSDMHLDNILVSGSHIKIIDYGFAVRLPEPIRKKFVRYYKTPASTASLNTAAQIYSMQYSNAIQWKRYDGQLNFYNPSYAALRIVWHAMSESNKSLLKKHHENSGHIIACTWK